MTKNKEKNNIIGRKRSPNYPYTNIEKAISMVTDLYNKYQTSPVPASLAMEAMGYSITSGKAQSILASLSYYDLLEIEKGPLKSKKVNISNAGLNIIRNPDEANRIKAIRAAALKPAMFKKIILKHSGKIPENSLLSWELETEYKFNINKIPHFIKTFNQTMKFAKIYKSDIINNNNEEETEKNQEIKQDKIEGIPEIEKANKVTITTQEKEIAKYPVGKDTSIRLIASGDITSDAIKKLIKHLEIDYDLNIDFKDNNN